MNKQRAIFMSGLCLTALTLYTFPPLTQEEKDDLYRYPKSVDDFKLMRGVMIKLADEHFQHVLITYLTIYINLQSFGFFGSSVLAIMSGPIFGFTLGFFLSHFCSVTGASLCYLMSKQFGAGFIEEKFPDKLNWFRGKIKENENNLFFYFLFLRVTPLLPNWFLNISSAVVGVPFKIFFTATAIGLVPYNFLLVKTGLTLDEISTIGFDYKTLASLMGLGLLSLLPTLCTKKDKMA